jgi:SAM-dependent methyltransferase
MAAMPWQEQIAYYRARATEYEVTSYRDVHGADQRAAALVRHLQPGGDLLEIACGTGLWTRHLADYAATVTAIDAAPEMIALARQQVTAGNVTFVTADILAWAPPRRFDTVFFAFWLSHVPSSAFGWFWSLLRSALASGGRVLFVDDQPAAAALETYVAGSGEVVERRLGDGPATGSSRSPAAPLISPASSPSSAGRRPSRGPAIGWSARHAPCRSTGSSHTALRHAVPAPRHDRATAATPIIQICMPHRLYRHAPVGAPNGGSASACRQSADHAPRPASGWGPQARHVGEDPRRRNEVVRWGHWLGPTRPRDPAVLVGRRISPRHVSAVDHGLRLARSG